MSVARLAGFLLALLALPASADVTLVQVVQGQSASGEGLLAKSLIEVSRGKMRLVTAVAPRLEGEAAKDDAPAEPWRVVQVLDLATTSLLVIDPDSRSYDERELGAVLDGPPVPRGRRPFTIVSSSVTLEPGRLMRKCLGSDCAHWHAAADLRLKGKGRRVRARLEADVWVASLAGEPQRALLDLIAFEAAYRRQTGSALSPLDRQAYRPREAAQRLGVEVRELERVLSDVRGRFSGLPGYPLTSSVVWWSVVPRDQRAAKPSKREPKLLQDPPPASRRPPLRLVRIDWHAPWSRVDRALARAQAGLGRPPAPGRPDVLGSYDRFQAELRAVIQALDARPAPRPQAEERPRAGEPAPGEASQDTIKAERLEAPAPASSREARAFEAFSDLAELVFVPGNLPEDRFKVPAGFRKR